MRFIRGEENVERASVADRVLQVIDYIFYLIYGLLIIRLILTLLAAWRSAGFARLIYGVTDLLYAPFDNILPSLTIKGGYQHRYRLCSPS